MTVKGFFSLAIHTFFKALFFWLSLLNLGHRNIDNIDEYGLLLIAVLLLEVPVLQKLRSEHMVLQLHM